MADRPANRSDEPRASACEALFARWLIARSTDERAIPIAPQTVSPSDESRRIR